MKNFKSYRCSKEKLKKELIEHFIDKKGNKVSKRDLCKDKEFLKSINCDRAKLSSSTISSWCERLINTEPYGIVSEEFLFNYHQKVTKKIPKDKKFSEWSRVKSINKNIVKEKIERIIDWNNKQMYLAMLKMNDIEFEIEKYKGLKDSDLLFMVEMYYSEEDFNKTKQMLNLMVENGDLKILDYIL